MGSKVRRPVAVIALSGVLWGTSFVAMKVGLEYVDPYSFAFLRLLLAFVFSFVLLRSGQRPRVGMLRDWRIWALGGFNAGGFILQYAGIALTTASRTALLTQSNVVVTALVSWRLLGEPMGPASLIALPVAILGVFLLVTGGDLSALSGGQAMGDLLVLLAGWMWSFFLVLNKHMVSKRETSIPQMVVWVMLVTAIATAPFALLLGTMTRAALPWEGWAAVAYTAAFCTVLPYVLFARAQRFVSATLAAVVLLIEVVVAIISSALMLGEQLALGSGLGAALICVSIFLASRSSGSRQ